jgi:DNA repair photolyase
MLDRLADIDLITVDSAVTSHAPGQRALQLISNRQMIAPDRLPVVLLMLHHDRDRKSVELFIRQIQPLCQSIQVIEEKSRNKTATHALALHAQHFPAIPYQERKERLLLLGRRGGGGKPEFIKPFTGGEGTTCGAWTPIVAYRKGQQEWIKGTRPQEEEVRATAIRGFIRGSYAQGVCPAECSFCYLRGLQGFGIKCLYLNIEDVLPELDALPRGTVVNWAELGGPVEQDPWMVDEQGRGSLVQTILDLSSPRGIVSFFLTKGIYEPYLQLQGKLALFAISLNAPAISSVFEPGGASPEERLRGLCWAIDNGLTDHTIRLGPIIPIAGYERHYDELFQMMADILGQRLKRVTVDILRFSPQMPGILRASFAPEIVDTLLGEMEPAVKSHKYRPSAQRQLQLYQWINERLTHHGLPQVKLTACKADPTEATQFLRAGAIGSMPCACHLSYRDVDMVRRGQLPVLQGPPQGKQERHADGDLYQEALW